MREARRRERVVPDLLRSNNAVIVLAGDITAETARQKAEQFFATSPRRPPIAKQDV